MTTKNDSLINRQWLTDSRQVTGTPGEKQLADVVFFAIRGEHHDGHEFIGELYRKGVRQFVVERSARTGTPDRAELSHYTEAEFREVDSSLQTLQTLAAEHRQQFQIPVIGITGSNGKTIVKEWLAHLLSDDFIIAKSPKSYNSQLGVPLSVHELTPRHTLGIFEAGISQAQEMSALERIIRPTIGLFTNVGTAHDEGFRTRKQKIAEKLRLFTHADTLIYCTDYTDIDEEVHLLLKAVNPHIQCVTWSMQGNKATYQVQLDGSELTLTSPVHGSIRVTLPFTDPASVENLTHCLVTMLTVRPETVTQLQPRLNRLRPVSMRLEQKAGINNCVLIDDSYNNDVAGLQLALRFLNQQTTRSRRVVFLSDVLQSGQPEQDLYALVSTLVEEADVAQFVGIGPVLSRNAHLFADNSLFYATTNALLAHFPFHTLQNSAVLVKGARPFSFERISNRLAEKVHGTVLDINLDSLTHNLNRYREKVSSSTKIMVMVKAFAYGSGSTEVAQLLQYHRVDYLAVAYADEGIALRKNGINLPIMVMNPAPETFSALLEYRLEPEIYSMRVLTEWSAFLVSIRSEERGVRSHPDTTRVSPSHSSLLTPDTNHFIHLKIDTGMHRLGFVESELPEVAAYLSTHPTLHVASVFSHLAGSDEARFNTFTQQQYETFLRSTTVLELALGYRPTRHILNSAGIMRFPDYKLDMVRLGIGLYGVEASGLNPSVLHTVGTLRTVISQIKTVRAGESIGYSRRGILTHDARIATLAIGYADGYDRRFGNGIGQVLVNGTRCETVGNVCMDMTMVDVTSAVASEGDAVIIFGPELPISELARQIGTIPYELLTGISERVKRVFFKEGN